MHAGVGACSCGRLWLLRWRLPRLRNSVAHASTLCTRFVVYGGGPRHGRSNPIASLVAVLRLSWSSIAVWVLSLPIRRLVPLIATRCQISRHAEGAEENLLR